MGIFGKKLPAYDPAATVQPEPSLVDRALNGVVGSLTGVNVLAMQHRKALEAAQRGFVADLQGQLQGAPAGMAQAPVANEQGGDISAAFAPQLTPTPAKAPLNINSPEMATIALRAQQLGVPIQSVVDILKAQQPNIAFAPDGTAINNKNGAYEGMVFPGLDKGIVSTRDAQGRLTGAQAIPGYADAAAGIAGATAGAQERAKAPYAFQTVTGPDGAPRVITNETAAELGSRGGVIARGQSPAQAAADRVTAEAGANANVNLPQALDSAHTAVSLIEQMKVHPGIDARTGWRAALPALPNTPGADFQAMADQLRGKVFLQAYGDLKGAGQITEVEGTKAQDAIARLNQHQTKAGYLKALSDLEDVINTGAQRAAGQAARLQPRAGGATGAAASAPPAPPAGQRQAGATYNTPRGPMKWTGTGWLPAN